MEYMVILAISAPVIAPVLFMSYLWMRSGRVNRQ
jgi:hypothetical protein